MTIVDPMTTEGPEFYLPDHTVYLPIRIRRELVLKSEDNRLWEATNKNLRTRKKDIV